MGFLCPCYEPCIERVLFVVLRIPLVVYVHWLGFVAADADSLVYVQVSEHSMVCSCV